MKRRKALICVIDALHAEIAALKSNDVASLERATADKLAGIEQVALLGTGPAGTEIRELADEANRLNETCRIYTNLMAANVRRRLQTLTGDGAVAGYRPGLRAAYA
ncbi:flagellar protein FlgN [Sphingomonas sp. CFBP 13728]|uniref:flagellar protein FlgN n=1 Tax=Sphingomonas sp. CFBP 13728 TaxID=2775294 RepID=UPI001781D678|nr:flagellar protein FlgN [Sphingomonas sp. CFBP 13728]MBD8619403.1 flagellar protein FlgN [Sphingomonas sp. CFBP 13728]